MKVSLTLTWQLCWILTWRDYPHPVQVYPTYLWSKAQQALLPLLPHVCHFRTPSLMSIKELPYHGSQRETIYPNPIQRDTSRLILHPLANRMFTQHTHTFHPLWWPAPNSQNRLSMIPIHSYLRVIPFIILSWIVILGTCCPMSWMKVRPLSRMFFLSLQIQAHTLWLIMKYVSAAYQSFFLTSFHFKLYGMPSTRPRSYLSDSSSVSPRSQCFDSSPRVSDNALSGSEYESGEFVMYNNELPMPIISEDLGLNPISSFDARVLEYPHLLTSFGSNLSRPAPS